MFENLEENMARDKALLSLATVTADYYHALVEQGIPEMTAATLTLAFQNGMLALSSVVTEEEGK